MSSPSTPNSDKEKDSQANAAPKTRGRPVGSTKKAAAAARAEEGADAENPAPASGRLTRNATGSGPPKPNYVDVDANDDSQEEDDEEVDKIRKQKRRKMEVSQGMLLAKEELPPRLNQRRRGFHSETLQSQPFYGASPIHACKGICPSPPSKGVEISFSTWLKRESSAMSLVTRRRMDMDKAGSQCANMEMPMARSA